MKIQALQDLESESGNDDAHTLLTAREQVYQNTPASPFHHELVRAPNDYRTIFLEHCPFAV